jgi:hypothetical protein
MRVLLAIIAICFSGFIAFGSIAAMMGAPSDPPPFIFRANQLLGVFCVLSSIAVLKKPSLAAIAVWIVTIAYAVYALLSHEFSQSHFFVALAATVTAVISFAWANEKLRLVSE